MPNIYVEIYVIGLIISLVGAFLYNVIKYFWVDHMYYDPFEAGFFTVLFTMFSLPFVAAWPIILIGIVLYGIKEICDEVKIQRALVK